MIKLSDHQRQKLLENPNIEEITEKHIHYSSSFKIKAVESYLKGLRPSEIFKAAGFESSLFDDDYCLYAIKRWKKKYKNEGRESLKISNTGLKAKGRPKPEDVNNLTYEELQTIVEIQRELIAELEKKKDLALAKKK
jgi:hypothetical protein